MWFFSLPVPHTYDAYITTGKEHLRVDLNYNEQTKNIKVKIHLQGVSTQLLVHFFFQTTRETNHFTNATATWIHISMAGIKLVKNK